MHSYPFHKLTNNSYNTKNFKHVQTTMQVNTNQYLFLSISWNSKTNCMDGEMYVIYATWCVITMVLFIHNRNKLTNYNKKIIHFSKCNIIIKYLKTIHNWKIIMIIYLKQYFIRYYTIDDLNILKSSIA